MIIIFCGFVMAKILSNGFHSQLSRVGKYEDKEKCVSFRIKYFVMRTVGSVIVCRHGADIVMVKILP
jgi:hypothetical protein